MDKNALIALLTDVAPEVDDDDLELHDRMRAAIDALRAEVEVDELSADMGTSIAPVLANAATEMQRMVDSINAEQHKTQALIRVQAEESKKHAVEQLQQKLTAVRHAFEQILGDTEVALKEQPITPDHRQWHTLVDNGGMDNFIRDWSKWADRLSRIFSDGKARLGRTGV